MVSTIHDLKIMSKNECINNDDDDDDDNNTNNNNNNNNNNITSYVMI